jgi:hypothetical protein
MANKTCFREVNEYSEKINIAGDLVLIHGFNDFENRAKSFKKKNYDLAFITDISYGDYQDFLVESPGLVQEDQKGIILKRKNYPYLIPSLKFSEYLATKLEKIVDFGIKSIFLSNAEFFVEAKYAKSFIDSYKTYYGESYDPFNTTFKDEERMGKFKTYLLDSEIEYVSRRIKEYAGKVNKKVTVYYSTLSLTGYATLKINSPFSNLRPIKYIDGYVANVFMASCRTKVYFEGELVEKPFELAYLQYSFMNKFAWLDKKDLYFSSDPVDEDTTITWTKNLEIYSKTLVAMLFNSEIDKFEISPFPSKIFNKQIPLKNPIYDPSPITDSYLTILGNVFFMLNRIKKEEYQLEGMRQRVGILVSERMFDRRATPGVFLDKVFDFRTSLAFPDFFGIALPLFKLGILVDAVPYDFISQEKGILAPYDIVFLSYSYMNMPSIDVHYTLRNYCENGHVVVFIDDLKDNFRDRTNHVQMILDIFEVEEPGIYNIGKGIFAFYGKPGYLISESKEETNSFLKFVNDVYYASRVTLKTQEYFIRRRDKYVLASLNDSIIQLKGNYLDITSDTYEVLVDPKVRGDKVLFDISLASDKELISSTFKVNDYIISKDNIQMYIDGFTNLKGYIVIKSLLEPKLITKDDIKFDYTYDNQNKLIILKLTLEHNNLIIINFK